jgi:hypothetical protein
MCGDDSGTFPRVDVERHIRGLGPQKIDEMDYLGYQEAPPYQPSEFRTMTAITIGARPFKFAFVLV